MPMLGVHKKNKADSQKQKNKADSQKRYGFLRCKNRAPFVRRLFWHYM